MVYETIDPQIALSVFIIYTTLAVFIWILTFFLGIHWYQYRKPSVRYLTLAFFFYAITPSILAGGMYVCAKTGFKGELYNYSLPVGFISMMIGHIFIILFTTSFFGLNLKKSRNYIIIDLLISLSLLHPNNNYGLSGENLRIPDIRIYTSMIMVLFSLFTFTRIALVVFKARKKIDDKYSRIGFQSLAWAQIFMIFFYILNTLDNIAFNILGWGDFTPFFYISIGSITLCLIGFYLGILLPVWILNKNLSEYLREILEEKLKVRKDPYLAKQHVFPPLVQKKQQRIITIQCPICRKSTQYEVPSKFLEAIKDIPRGMVSISIRKGLMCSHQFFMFIDKNFDVRGYEKIDLDLGELSELSLNHYA